MFSEVLSSLFRLQKVFSCMLLFVNSNTNIKKEFRHNYGIHSSQMSA